MHRFPPFLSTGTGRRTSLPRSFTKGDHDFPDMIMLSAFYPVANPFLAFLSVFTATSTDNLPVPVHGNGIS